MSDLPHVTRLQVRFRDMDAMGHVNHAVYLTYLEVARTEYWFALTSSRSIEAFTFIVLKAECLYQSPAVLGEELVIQTGITRLGNTSFTMSYQIRESVSGRDVAKASTELVMYDYARKKPARIPPEVRANIERFEREIRSAGAASSP
jgi:acyl-CoA thioester hydrolase